MNDEVSNLPIKPSDIFLKMIEKIGKAGELEMLIEYLEQYNQMLQLQQKAEDIYGSILELTKQFPD